MPAPGAAPEGGKSRAVRPGCRGAFLSPYPSGRGIQTTSLQAAPSAPFRRPNGIVVEGSEPHGCGERRKGPGRPLYAGPWSNDGVREPRRRRGRMSGARPFGSFWGNAKRNPPSRAEPMPQPTRKSAAAHEIANGAAPCLSQLNNQHRRMPPSNTPQTAFGKTERHLHF